MFVLALFKALRLVRSFVLLVFSKSFFFTAFLSLNIEIVSQGNETKTFVNKFFDVVIAKYTLHLLLTFTV